MARASAPLMDRQARASERMASARYPERDQTPIHSRMPAILPSEAWSAWLGEGASERR
jgi:putative SOS response-associated peptidase YedK